MSLAVSVVLTAWFVVCAAWALTRAKGRGHERRSHVSHVGMAAAMVLMTWWAAPGGVAAAALVGTCAAAAWLLLTSPPGRRRLVDLHHVGMLAVMSLMWVTMAQGRPAASAGTHHHSHAGPVATATGSTEVLLIGSAVLLAGVSALWLGAAARQGRRRADDAGGGSQGLEGMVSLGMAVAAAAMAVAH